MKLLISLTNARKYSKFIRDSIDETFYGFYNYKNYISAVLSVKNKLSVASSRTFFIWNFGWIDKKDYIYILITDILTRKEFIYTINEDSSITFSEESIFRIQLEIIDDVLVIS